MKFTYKRKSLKLNQAEALRPFKNNKTGLKAFASLFIMIILATGGILFPVSVEAATKLLDEYVHIMQNGSFNKPARIKTISKYSTSQEVSTGINEKISDDEFFEFMNLVSETENENLLYEIKMSEEKIMAGKTPSAGIFKIFGEYYSTNKKPGYLLLKSGDSDGEDYGYDYESAGYSSGFLYKFNAGPSIGADYSSRRTTEDSQDEFGYQKLCLSTSTLLLKDYKISANFNQLSSDVSDRLNEFGVDFGSPAGTFDWGGGISKNVYASGLSSFLAPAHYRRYYLNAGYIIADEFYLQLSPAFEDYYEDKNKKTEIITSLLYYPNYFPDVSFDIYHRAMKFKKNGEDDKSFVYFTPESNTGIGILANYQVKFRKKTSYGLSLSLNREEYTYNDELTQYYTASAMTKISHSFNRFIRFEARYGFSISQSDGFPLSQNLKINTTCKF